MTRLANVPITRIRLSPNNPRHEATGLDELAASIKAVGIIEPLVVSFDKSEDDEKARLICGFRRFSAAKVAKLKEVPCLILGPTDERMERSISLVENLHRRDMSHVEQGEAFIGLLNTGMNQLQVARATGVSEFVVSTKVSLVRGLIPEFRELVHRDHMTMKEGLSLSRLSAAEQRQIFENGRGTQRRQSNVPTQKRTNAEGALMTALSWYRAGQVDLALGEAQRAVRSLAAELGRAQGDAA